MCEDIYYGKGVIDKYKLSLSDIDEIKRQVAKRLIAAEKILNNYLGNSQNPKITIEQAVYTANENYPFHFNIVLYVEYNSHFSNFCFECLAKEEQENENTMFYIKYINEDYKFNLDQDTAGINLTNSENLINKFCNEFSHIKKIEINIGDFR